jgi:ribonuclease P protein component
VPAGDGGSPDAHVGFAIGRRVGTAVVRNRLRRRLRNILSGTPIGPGDYLVSVDPLAATVSYSELKALVSHALQALPPTPPHPTPTP